MNRVWTCLAVAFSLVLAVPPAHAQWLEQVSSQIHDFGDRVADTGYRLIDDSKTGSLNSGASTTVTLTLVSGREYVIFGACDDDCGDLDLRLYDASGTEIDEDVEIDAVPVVTASASQGASFTVEVLMVECSSEPCFWGLGVFEQSTSLGQGGPQATRRFAGELAPGDPTFGAGEYIDSHTFDVTAGRRVVVDLRSTQFDTYLIVRQPSGDQTDNDDFEGSTSHSQVDLVAPESGEWTVVVTSYQGGETGPYEVTVTIEGVPQVGSSGPRFESGRLESADEALSSGEYADYYRFQGHAGERVVIDLRSNDFDPYLIVRTPSGEQLDNDDYEGDASRSLLSLTLTEDGEFGITVTSYRPEETGGYDLQIASGAETSTASGLLRERGVLSSGDETLRSGEFVDRYEFTAVPGQRVTIDLRSDEFDTYLIVRDPRGDRQENDDTDRPGHSVIEMDATESGAYQVLVTSYETGETGSYDLQIDVGDAASSATSSGRDVVRLSVGQESTGRLEAGDGRLEDGEYRDLYVFDGQAGQSIVVDMNSSAFDTYLGIITPSGEAIENDDYEGSTTRSVVELTLRESGRYQVIATSYGAGQTGAYHVALRASDTPVVARDDTPTGSGGRVYGIFAGISDYGGRASDLAYTAEDAVRVRDAMLRGGGMRAEDGILLTDAQATTGGIRNAIQQIANRAGPDDTFVFFYSGHGGRVPRSGQQASDPDGLDETIELYDAGINDDDFSQLLGQVNAGKIILVLDACFSGGFSKDVISVPGRMGLFSSEEDVTSSVAAKFRAGGFLAVFVADAIGDGLADADGDGAINAIELSQYVHERYRADLKSGGVGDFVRTGGPQLGYQHLVVDRGSIRPHEILFAPR